MKKSKSLPGLTMVLLCTNCGSEKQSQPITLEEASGPTYPLQVEVSRTAGSPFVCAGSPNILFPDREVVLVLDPTSGEMNRFPRSQGKRVVPFCDLEEGPEPIFVELTQFQTQNRLEVLRESPLEIGLSCVNNIQHTLEAVYTRLGLALVADGCSENLLTETLMWVDGDRLDLRDIGYPLFTIQGFHLSESSFVAVGGESRPANTVIVGAYTKSALDSVNTVANARAPFVFPAKGFLLSGADEERLLISDYASGEVIQSFVEGLRTTNGFLVQAAGDRGRFILYGSSDGTFGPDWQPLLLLVENGEVVGVAASPASDGPVLVSAAAGKVQFVASSSRCGENWCYEVQPFEFLPPPP